MAEQGTRIADRYELLAPLGEGGMGVVWRARDTRLGRAVAVKLLAAGSLGSDRARARMLREARAAATLEHEGIIRVYDVGELEDGGAFLVMELVRGRSLRDELSRGPMPPARAARIAASAARALDFAHKSGVVHRDVKPDNIMLRDLRERTPNDTPNDGPTPSVKARELRDRVIVVDFGVAKPVATDLVADAETLAGITAATLTGAGQIVGTPAYLSPEQARGPDVGPETDQWALAVTVFEAITGERPWTGKGVVEVVASILRDAPTSLRKLSPAAPAELEAALVRALQKEPEARFPDMAAFADALETAVVGLSADDQQGSVTATGPGAQRETVSTHGGQSTTKANTVSASRSSLVALAAAFVVIVAGAWILRTLPRGTTAAVADAAPSLDGAIACPLFEVTGVDAPELGAAAATLACDRLQLVRGGADAHAIGPAELAGAPSEISPGSPSHLFEKPETRLVTLEAAKRASAWIDGKLEKRVDRYTATIVLRTSEGAEIARGDGHGLELFEAVRAAVGPIVPKIPRGKADLDELEQWLDVRSVDDALALQDVRTAILIEDLVSLREACAAAIQRPGLSPRVVYLTKSSCQRRLRTGPMTEPPPPLDESTPGALITTALAQGAQGGPAAVRERAASLEKARDAATIPEGKARLAAAAAELYNLIGDNERASKAARAAIHSSPKAVDWRTNAWHRVAYTSTGDAALAGAISAWQPWEPIAQAVWGSQPQLSADSSAERSLSIQRAYHLSQRGTYAFMYGVDLTDRGDLEAARGVAERANDDLLRVEIMLAEARYGAVVKKVPELVEALPANDENAALAFRLTHLGVRAALVLDRPADFVEPVVERFVLSEPHHVVDGVMPMLSLIHSCSLAPRPIGRKCIARLEQLRHDGKLASIFATMETVLAGAGRFVADDYPGAVKAWRTLLRSAGWVQGPLRDPVVIAFEKAGELDLAEEVDSPTVALVDMPRAADISWVRAARRAMKRGDHDRAKKLAQVTVEKWRFADETIPAVQEMKDLLAKVR